MKSRTTDSVRTISMPLTRRMSSVDIAVDGITLLACAPIRLLAMPRIFSEGCVSSSYSPFVPSSVAPSQKSRINCASIDGTSAIALRSIGPSGSTWS